MIINECAVVDCPRNLYYFKITIESLSNISSVLAFVQTISQSHLFSFLEVTHRRHVLI